VGRIKNLYLYCVLEQFIHLLENMHSLEKKKTQKIIKISEKKKRSARRTKASTFIVFLNPRGGAFWGRRGPGPPKF